MISVGTNASSLSAIRNLEQNTRRLQDLQIELATGLSVSSVKDGAAFSLAQRLRGDLSGLNATLASIDHATIAVDVALVGTESISDILIQMKGKAVSLANARENGAEQEVEAFENDLRALGEQIKSTISLSTVGGVNLIDQGNDIISALVGTSGDQTLDFAHQDLSFGGELLSLTEESSFGLDEIESSLNNVNGALSHFSTASEALEVQREFVLKVKGVVENSVGRLVDANLAETAANIQAAQVKQELGVIALNIANRSPQLLSQLFENQEKAV